MKRHSDEKVAILLEFQAFNNVECLFAYTDSLKIFSFDSDNFIVLKKKIFVKLNSNSFAVLHVFC